MVKPVILPRAEHTISRALIDPDALKVLTRLRQFNHVAYLVGGSVRDLIAAHASLDALLDKAAEIPQKRYREALQTHGGHRTTPSVPVGPTPNYLRDKELATRFPVPLVECDAYAWSIPSSFRAPSTRFHAR